MRAVLLFFAAAIIAVAQVQITQEPGKIRVDIDGKPFTEFFTAANGDVPKPFLHPLRSASGKIVTRRWPQEQNTGEETDHPHHRGVFELANQIVFQLDFGHFESSLPSEKEKAACPPEGENTRPVKKKSG